MPNAVAVAFWWLPEEEAKFIAYLTRDGSVRGFPVSKARTKEHLESVDLHRVLATNADDLYLTREDFAEHISVGLCELNGDTFYALGLMESCAIAYDRARFNAQGKLLPANLCYYKKYPDDTVTIMLSKPKGFITWARRVFRWVHKAVPERHPDPKDGRPMSRRVFEGLMNGTIQVASY